MNGSKQAEFIRRPSTKYDSAMGLKPILNMKVDELFLKWICLPEQSYLFDQLRKIPYEPEYTDSKKNDQPKESQKTKEAILPPGSLKDDTKPILSPRRLKRNTKTASNGIKPRHEEDQGIIQSSDTVDSTKGKNHVAHSRKKHNIPRFYFPHGNPRDHDTSTGFEEAVVAVFSSLDTKMIKLSQMAPICKACGCPLYWKSCLFKKAAKGPVAAVSESDIITIWKKVISEYHDDASRFVILLAKEEKNFLHFDDLLPLMKDVVDTHPGLSFLKDAPEFHTRYMNTVIARIFYSVNRSWSGKITPNELRRSNFLTVLKSLETEPDINSVNDFFSYEDFYVIYCKFWELDTDHDLIIDANDLSRHADGVLVERLIERILSGAVRRSNVGASKNGCMSYVDFIWFLLSEEDKNTKTSIEYWFRCMDLDGDGFISLYEMEYFYEEQVRKLELLDIEPLPFSDCACLMLDMIKPAYGDCIALSDLKKSQMAKIFFDTFLNVEKYLEHEQKDPFANSLNENEEDFDKRSDWEKYATQEYELLVAEEQANEIGSLGGAIDDDLQIMTSMRRLPNEYP